jgi:hypothetical protein
MKAIVAYKFKSRTYPSKPLPEPKWILLSKYWTFIRVILAELRCSLKYLAWSLNEALLTHEWRVPPGAGNRDHMVAVVKSMLQRREVRVSE